MLKQSEITGLFTEKTQAYLQGHFQLTSGLHSPNYFQCAKVLQHPQYLTLLCQDMAQALAKYSVQCVISPALGGIVAGTETGRLLGKKTIFAEREGGEMSLRRGFELAPGERCAIVEDVLTTGKSIGEVLLVVQKHQAQCVAVHVIVDRSSSPVNFSVPMHSLLTMEVVTYQPEKCPLCKQGVPLVKPGSRNVK
jgi:orotate phosphoribosyltransferase